MKKLVVACLTLLMTTSVFANCLKKAQEESSSLGRRLLQDTVESINITDNGSNVYSVDVVSEVDPEHTYVTGKFKVTYDKSCKRVKYEVVQGMVEHFADPGFDYSRDYDYDCDHCN